MPGMIKEKSDSRKSEDRNFLVVQWLGLSALTARGPGSISGWGTKIPQATQHGQKKKRGRGGGRIKSAGKRVKILMGFTIKNLKEEVNVLSGLYKH